MNASTIPFKRLLRRARPFALMLVASANLHAQQLSSMSLKSGAATIPFILLLMSYSNLHAQQQNRITLKGSAAVPPVVTLATGTGHIAVLPDRTLRGNIKTSGLAATTVHIHEAAAGENGREIVTLTRSIGDRFVVPVDAKLSESQYASYLAGKLYIDAHSVSYPDGEIRAQLLRPETTAKPMILAK